MNSFSFVWQVFGSVETVDQIEAEPRPVKGEAQHSSPVKDIPNDTTDPPQLPSCNPPSPDLSNQHPGSENTPLPLSDTTAESITPQKSVKVSEDLNEKITSGSQPGGEVVMDPAVKDKVSETEKMETVSKSELLEDAGKSKPKETSAAEEKPAVEEKDQTTHELSKVLDASINLKSAPENTNVLKLETEIHNEYFQAPPLGQTLTFQAHKSKDLEVEPLCVPTTKNDTNLPTEKKPEISEKPETISEKNPPQMIKTCVTDSERRDAEALLCDLAETKKDKAAEIPFEKPGSNSPVRQVLNALQSASRGSLSLSSHSRQSPDTADSDDSPSALEMEDIPAGITCVTSEDIKARPLAGLAAPPISQSQREKMASEDLVLDHHLDTACNTSPEGTDLGLSEEEPEMENVLTEPESAEVGGDTKHDESSEEQTYSVSIKHDKQAYLFFYLINMY